jgi:hypothetical protein
MLINSMLPSMIAELIVFRMFNPTDKQVNVAEAKVIFTNHPAAIPANVKNHPVAPPPQ